MAALLCSWRVARRIKSRTRGARQSGIAEPRTGICRSKRDAWVATRRVLFRRVDIKWPAGAAHASHSTTRTREAGAVKSKPQYTQLRSKWARLPPRKFTLREKIVTPRPPAAAFLRGRGARLAHLARLPQFPWVYYVLPDLFSHLPPLLGQNDQYLVLVGPDGA